jgi:beta-lactamase regulating signal transducer with metallopeptidase domain
MADMLFDLLLRVVAVLVAATLAVSAMRQSSASLRALVWTATLLGALVIPFISLAAPQLRIAVLPAERAINAPVTMTHDTSPANVEQARAERGSPVVGASRATLPVQHDQIEQSARGRETHDRATKLLTWLVSRIPVTSLLVGVWILGALLLLARLTLGHIRLAQLVSSASNASNDWRPTVDAIGIELGIRRPVDVRMSRDIDIPAVAGVLMPVLLLPASAAWSASEKRDVALHELAHVARWDALAQLLSNVACAIYWFIPLSWYAARQAAALREQACDNVVLRAGTRPSLYAERLLTFANASMSTTPAPVALAMARPANITRRVLGILDTNTRRTQLSARNSVQRSRRRSSHRRSRWLHLSRSSNPLLLANRCRSVAQLSHSPRQR